MSGDVMSGDKMPAADITDRRPNPQEPWQCGYTPLGFGCVDGPNQHGVCCQIEAINGQHSVSAEPAGGMANHGNNSKCDPGDCEHGCGISDACEVAKLRRAAALPSHAELGPCIPRKSYWFSRQNLVLNVAILVGGVLLLCMALPGAKRPLPQENCPSSIRRFLEISFPRNAAASAIRTPTQPASPTSPKTNCA